VVTNQNEERIEFVQRDRQRRPIWK